MVNKEPQASAENADKSYGIRAFGFSASAYAILSTIFRADCRSVLEHGIRPIPRPFRGAARALTLDQCLVGVLTVAGA